MIRTIRIDDLNVVMAVANHGSFVAAARDTGIPTSTVSRAVARFEDAAGVRLFQRTSRRVRLTHEGALLLDRAGPLLDELDDVIDDVAGDAKGLTGRLRVTAPVVSGAGRIAASLLAFAEAHPKVSVELSLTNAVVDLVEGGIDLAFRAGPVQGADLVARKLWAVPFAIAASRAFVQRELSRRKTVDRAALESLPAIVARAGIAWTFRRADGIAVDVRPRARFLVNDPRVALEAAQRGLGMVRAPREHIAAAGLVALEPTPEVGESESREMYAVYPSRRLVPKRVRLAIDWVKRGL